MKDNNLHNKGKKCMKYVIKNIVISIGLLFAISQVHIYAMIYPLSKETKDHVALVAGISAPVMKTVENSNNRSHKQTTQLIKKMRWDEKYPSKSSIQCMPIGHFAISKIVSDHLIAISKSQEYLRTAITHIKNSNIYVQELCAKRNDRYMRELVHDQKKIADPALIQAKKSRQ